jgi:hypothetical protein
MARRAGERMTWRHDGLRAGVESVRRAARRTAWEKTIAVYLGRAIEDGWGLLAAHRQSGRPRAGLMADARGQRSVSPIKPQGRNRFKQEIMSATTQTPMRNEKINLFIRCHLVHQTYAPKRLWDQVCYPCSPTTVSSTTWRANEGIHILLTATTAWYLS